CSGAARAGSATARTSSSASRTRRRRSSASCAGGTSASSSCGWAPTDREELLRPAMKIVELRASPTSFPLPPEASVTLGIGRAVKRDAVVVKVTTDDGLVGWGEAHHGRAPGAVAHLINTTLRQLVRGMEAADVVGVWQRVYTRQLASHGMGAGASIALSGI